MRSTIFLFLLFFSVISRAFTNPFEIYQFKSSNYRFEGMSNYGLNTNQPKVLELFKELQGVEETSINPERDRFKIIQQIERIYLKGLFEDWKKNRQQNCKAFKDKFGGDSGCLSEFVREFLPKIPLQPGNLLLFSKNMDELMGAERDSISTKIKSAPLLKIKENNDHIGLRLMVISHLLQDFSVVEKKALGQKGGKAYKSSMDLLQTLNYFIKSMPSLIKWMGDTKFQMKKKGSLSGINKEFFERERQKFQNFQFQYKKIQKAGLSPNVIKAKMQRYKVLLKNIK